jgi:hypothetical protein
VAAFVITRSVVHSWRGQSEGLSRPPRVTGHRPDNTRSASRGRSSTGPSTFDRITQAPVLCGQRPMVPRDQRHAM